MYKNVQQRISGVSQVLIYQKRAKNVQTRGAKTNDHQMFTWFLIGHQMISEKRGKRSIQ